MKTLNYDETKNGYPTFRETIKGLDVVLTFEDEHLSPYAFYNENDEYFEQDIKAICNGDVSWLCAIVTVYFKGHELDYTTLGCIEYPWDKLDNFLTDGNFDDMVDEVMSSSLRKLRTLYQDIKYYFNEVIK